MKSKLIILGCGSSLGVPRIDGFWGNCDKNNKKNTRSRCSALIIKGKNSILIDTSPDIRKQLLINKVTNISSVVLTHEHADQTNGLFELRPFLWKNKKMVNIYSNLKTSKILKKAHGYLFNGSKGYPPVVKSNLVKSKFSLGNNLEKVFFDTVNVKHGKTISTAYIFEKTAYISDCNDLSIINKKELKNLNYLIIDCLRLEKHSSHFNLDECMYVHNHLKPKKTILTNLHYSLDYNNLIKNLPNNIRPAYDGLKLNL